MNEGSILVRVQNVGVSDQRVSLKVSFPCGRANCKLVSPVIDLSGFQDLDCWPQVVVE